jgi:hypothetical protein
VTRVERSAGEIDFDIAVECKTPMTEIEHYLSPDWH